MKYTIVKESTSQATWDTRLAAAIEELGKSGYELVGGLTFQDVPGSFQIACQAMACPK
jgi:hypothetical protein